MGDSAPVLPYNTTQYNGNQTPVNDLGNLIGYDYNANTGQIEVVGEKGRWGYEGFVQRVKAMGLDRVGGVQDSFGGRVSADYYNSWISGAANVPSYDIAIQKQKGAQAEKDLAAQKQKEIADKAATMNVANQQKSAGYQSQGRGGTLLGGAGAVGKPGIPKPKTLLGY